MHEDLYSAEGTGTFVASVVMAEILTCQREGGNDKLERVKKKINHKVYDTKKAELIYEYENGYEVSNFQWMAESLYRSKKGDWFLAGEGGPSTKYRKISDDGYTYGDGLEPISAVTALEWLKQFGDTETIERYFADNIK